MQDVKFNMEKETTILLIDDDEMLQNLVTRSLEEAHYHCISAYNGEEGLRMILEHQPDLILLDFIMPGMNGDEVYLELRANPKYAACRNIPVIILTAKDDDVLMKTKMLEVGIQAYLTKPFGLRELKNIIENIFITHEIRLKNLQLQQEVSETKEHLELLIDNVPLGILATDMNGSVIKVNRHLNKILRISSPEKLFGFNLLEQNLFGKQDLRHTFRTILEEGVQITLDNFEYHTPIGEWTKLNLRAVPLKNATSEISGLILLVKDTTELEKKAYELSILRQIGVAMQGTLNLDILLNLILTSITAGCALGFSRAVLLLLSEDGKQLFGKLGVGPNNPEEAGEIWNKLSQEHLNLQSFLEKYGKRVPEKTGPFNQKVQQICLDLNFKDCLIAQAVLNKQPIKVTSQIRKERICSQCYGCVGADEFVVVPLMVKNKVIGAIIADNMYNFNPIDDNMMELLVLFASQAAVAIERAEAYQKLEEEKNKLEQAYLKLQQARDQSIKNERLATIGQMAAQVAHEIRNPLVTIGGFARSLVKSDKVASDEELKMLAQIIAEEVSRLERILNNVLDFVKLTKPEFQLENVNRIVEDSLLMIQDDISNKNISLNKTLDPDLKPIKIDPQQFKQVLLNVLQNAIYSMENGTLSVRTFKKDPEHLVVEIEDTGEGIPEEILANMFNPFFTTKPKGTGLGLPITQQIITAHGGEINVQSQVGKGTTFTFTLPLEMASEKPDISF